MRFASRVVALLLVLVALLVPLAADASNGPCPDDPVLSAQCLTMAPPYYVVINRSVEHLYPERTGTGCEPIILNNPACTDCVGTACTSIDVEAKVCQFLPRPPFGETHVVYEMCCDCATDPDGNWLVRVRDLQPNGSCPVREGTRWVPGLPPGTGIDLPTPLVVGGLAVIGLGLLGAGILLRRRALRSA
jgi:hypothetical protein